MTTDGWDPNLGPMVAIPEPFWRRSWRTRFRWMPGCYSCRLDLATLDEWERHWLSKHYESAEG
jgi:hypothetical protein